MMEISPKVKVESSLEEKLNNWREFGEQAEKICRQIKSGLTGQSADQSSEIESIEDSVRKLLDYIENPTGPDPEERLRNKAMTILGPLQLFKLKNKDLVDQETGQLIDSLAEFARRIR